MTSKNLLIIGLQSLECKYTHRNKRQSNGTVQSKQMGLTKAWKKITANSCHGYLVPAGFSSCFIQFCINIFSKKAAWISSRYLEKAERLWISKFECVRNIFSLQVISLSGLYCHPAVIKETKISKGLNILFLVLFKKQITGYSLFGVGESMNRLQHGGWKQGICSISSYRLNL